MRRTPNARAIKVNTKRDLEQLLAKERKEEPEPRIASEKQLSKDANAEAVAVTAGKTPEKSIQEGTKAPCRATMSGTSYAVVAQTDPKNCKSSTSTRTSNITNSCTQPTYGNGSAFNG